MSTVKSSPSLLESGDEDEARRLTGEAEWDEASCGDSVRVRLASRRPLTSRTGDGVSGFAGKGGGLHSSGGGSLRLGSSLGEEKLRTADRAGGPPLLPMSCLGDCLLPSRCARPSLSSLMVVSSVLVSLPAEPVVPWRCTSVSSMSWRSCSAESLALEWSRRRALRNSGSSSS